MTKVELTELKKKMYRDFVYVFFDKWFYRADDQEQVTVEFDLEPYKEYVDTVNKVAFRLYFARETKEYMIATKAIEINDYIVKFTGAYDDAMMKAELEKSQLKYASYADKKKYQDNQEKKKNSWRNMGINMDDK